MNQIPKIAVLILVPFIIIGLALNHMLPKKEPRAGDFPVVAIYMHSPKDVTIARQNPNFPDVIFYHLGVDDGVPIESVRFKTDLLVEQPLRVETLSYTNQDSHYVQDVTVHIHSIYDINYVK